MTAVHTGMTLAEFLTLRERRPPLEYEDGRVTRKVSPKARHSVLQTWLASEWNRYLRPAKLGLAFTELRSTFATLSRAPDVAVYQRERILLDEQGRIVDDFCEPPDIAIEIASPGQRRSRLLQRCQRLVDAGVRVTLLIQPSDESVTVVRRGEDPIRLDPDVVLDLSEIIPGLRLDTGALFAALRL